jgi:tetratricopeptide (TPR) repeat protein
MRISYIALNRIVEDKMATDEAYRNALAQKGKLTLASGRALSDEALLGKLASLGLGMDRDEFLRRTRSYLSAQEMAEAVYANPPQRLSDEETEWVWIAFTCLWERWSPERPSLEMIDDRMQEGYKARARGDRQEACRLWLETWKSIWAVVEARHLGSVEEFDELFRGTQSLFNQVQDFLMELHNAGFREKSFHLERLAVLEALLGRFELGILLPNIRNDLGETLFFLGRPEQAEQLYRQWLAETPRWGWGWIRWSDGYTFCIPGMEKNQARAEQILKQGLAIPDVEERRYLLERLADLYEETGRAGEAKAVREEIERLERPRPTPRSTPALPPGAEARSRTAGTRREERGMPAGLPGARALPSSAGRVGRNDPCPCGSGKKFKKCCGRG